jgi:transcriptional regulator with XRE-family HTH domain
MRKDSAARLLREARESAGLTQRELAKKARTSQSVIASIELEENSPSWDNLSRLLRAAGQRLVTSLERIAVVDRSILDDVPRILRMTPEQRLEEVANVSRFTAAVRRV